MNEELLESVRRWANEAGLDPQRYVDMLHEFYAECPHVEAALAYLVEEGSLELAARPGAKRLPIEIAIDAAVKMNTDKKIALRERNKKEGN